jgi:hypothetical protein
VVGLTTNPLLALGKVKVKPQVRNDTPRRRAICNSPHSRQLLCKLARIDNSAGHVMGRLLNQPQLFPRLGIAAQKVDEQVTPTENDCQIVAKVVRHPAPFQAG